MYLKERQAATQAGKAIVENPLGAHSVAPRKLRHCPLQRRHYECKRSAARVDVALVLWSESVRRIAISNSI